MIKTQHQETAVDKLLESMKDAYLDEDSVKMQDISKTILKLHYQNEIFIMKNPQLKLEKVRKENKQLIDLYSNILVLQVRMHNKEFEKRGSN